MTETTVDPTGTVASLRETHWHKGDCSAWDTIREAISRVEDSNLRLWAHRVDRKTDTPHLPHVYLFAVDVSHYAKRADGVYAPDGREFSFFVAADNSKDARERAWAELQAHGFVPSEWAIGLTVAPMILVATPKAS